MSFEHSGHRAWVVAFIGTVSFILTAGEGPAQTPLGTAFTYQAQIEDSGTPVTGTISGRYALFDAETGGSQVGSTLTPPDTGIIDGLLIQELDFGPGVFDGTELFLQVEIDTDGGADSFVLLGDRTKVAPTPYSIYAENAGTALNVTNDAVDDADADPANEVNTSLTLTSATLELTDSGGTLTADLSSLAGSAFGDGHSLDAVDGDPVDAVFVDGKGRMGIGTTTPSAGLHVVMGSKQPLQLGVAKDGVGTFTDLDRASGVFVSGTTAYVASGDDNSLTIIDISDPANPTQLGVAKDGVGTFTDLRFARGVFVSGTTAYVASFFDNSLTIIDVSDPANPAQLSVAKDGVGPFTDLNGARSVFVSGTTVYVASQFDHSLTIIDVSDPANPAQLAVAKDGVGTFTDLLGAFDVFVSGTTAYVASTNDDSLTIIDVSDPANPAQLGVAKDGVGTFTDLGRASGVFVSGTTAYVASGNDNSLTIIDVSDPANPAQLGVAKDGVGPFDDLAGAVDVFVSGTTACVASIFDSSLTIIDVSDPANPAQLGVAKDNSLGGTFTQLNSANGVFVSGTTAYVASFSDDSLTIIDVDIAFPELTVEGDSLISGTVTATAFAGDGSALTGITDNVDDADADPGNELNTGLILNGSTLELTDADGTLTADLSPLAGSAFGDGHSLDGVDGNPVDAVFVDARGSMGIGTTVPSAGLHVAMASKELLQLGVAKDSVGTFNDLRGARGVFVSGTTAWVASGIDNSLTIIDVSDPANPAQLAVAKDGVGTFTDLEGARGVFVSGTTAYVASGDDNSLTIIDVSDPANPAQLAVAKDGVGTFTDLEGAFDVFVSGTTAYVASGDDNSLTIIDVSDSANPAQLGVAKDGVGTFTDLGRAISVFVLGTTAYVASLDDDSLTMIDVSDPANPAELGVARDDSLGGTFTNLSTPLGVFVSGTTAYVVANSSLTMIDVSDPANPAQLGVARDNSLGGTFTDLRSARGVFVSGTTAYVVSQLDDALTMIDVSDPANPAQLAVAKDNSLGGTFTDLDGAGGVFVSGTTAYVTSQFDHALTIIDVDIALPELIVEGDSLISGRVGIGIDMPAFPLHVGTDTTNGNGAHVTEDGMWTNGSSRSFKSNFRSLDPVSVLETLIRLPIQKWSYDGNPEQDHIGPTAEDFHEAFGLGHSDRYIGTVDADGVALIAIQGLNRKLEEETARNEELEARLARLEELLAVNQSESPVSPTEESPQMESRP